VNAVDWIGLNTHPYCAAHDPLIGNVGADQVGAAHYLASYFSEKGATRKVHITATGYPDFGVAFKLGNKSATPSLKGLQAFASSVEDAARSDRVPVYYFASFDGDWMRRRLPNATDADYHFVLFNCDRSQKCTSFPSPRED
jgi:exo-beta-1,3-glucanase (GH17 family)